MARDPVRIKLPRGVIALGFVSLFMDMSSELIHGLMPIFLVGTLGASATMLGAFEGFAEAISSIVKVFSGALSDRFGKRKNLIVIGYGLAMLAKPLFPLANSIGTVVAARAIDRVGKGIRGAPRDALVADITPPDQRGAAYGLRQSMDTVGAIIGPLIGIGLMILLANNIRAVLWFAVIPAIIATTVLVAFVKDAENPTPHKPKKFNLRQWSTLGRSYWTVLIVGGILTLARFSEAFLVLRAADVGLPTHLAPLVLVVLSVTFTLTAYPAGILADRLDPRRLLSVGLVTLVVADVILALASSSGAVLAGVAVWGIHLGFTQGILSKMVADAVQPEDRGTAFGVFGLVTGVLLIAASTAAGQLWDRVGPQATFWAGGSLALLGLIALPLSARALPRPTP